MAKNTSKAPLKWQVWADNNGLSSNYIQFGIDAIKEQAESLIDDINGPIYSSAKIYSMLPDKTESGAVASFSDAIPELPVKAYNLKITPYLDGSGDPAPDNVRDIMGWDKITLFHSGADTSDPSEIEIDLGDIVYKGEINSDGTGTITMATQTFDHTSNWTYENVSGKKNFYVPMDPVFRAGQSLASNILCNCSPIAPTNSSANDTCFISAGRNFNFTWGNTLDISSAADFKTYLETNNLQIVVLANLVTSIPFSVDNMPTIKTITGENNIWCDTGDTSITYKTYPS